MESSVQRDNPVSNPESEARALRLAIDQARRGNAVAARILLSDICARDPGNEVAWLWRASLATTADEGLAYISQVLQINPQNSTALGWLTKMGRSPAPPAAAAVTPAAATPVDTLRSAVVEAAKTAPRPQAVCPLCEGAVEPEVARCPHCRAVLIMKESADYALRHAQDPALAIAATERWEAIAAKGSLEATLALATIFLNTLDYARATECLKKALAQGLPTPAPALLRDGLLLKTLMQPVVMVVDDSATIRDVVVRSLAPHEMLPLPVGNAWDVIPTMLTQKPALVLLDVTMPEVDGITVCRKIRAHKDLRHTPVVMLTGHDDLIDKLVGKMAGASEYLTKPFKPEGLLRAVRKHLGKRRAP